MNAINYNAPRPAVGDPVSGLDLPISWIEGMYGQDFGLRLRFDDVRASREVQARRQRSAETVKLVKTAWAKLAAVLGRLLEPLAQWNRAGLSRDTLMAMPAHRLADLGLTRDQVVGIGSAVTRPAPAAATPGAPTPGAAARILERHVVPAAGTKPANDTDDPLAA